MNTIILHKCACGWTGFGWSYEAVWKMHDVHVFEARDHERNHRLIPSAISNPIKPYVVGYLLESNVRQGVTR